MSSKLRIFVAIGVSKATRQSLRSMQQALDVKGLSVKWTRPDHFHVTLKFLGEIDGSSVDLVVASTQRAVSGRGIFSLTFQGVGAFPDWERPRVLWARVADGHTALSGLAREVEAALERVGFSRSDRPFQPHLTLGRVRAIEPGVDLTQMHRHAATYQAGPEWVERAVVYQSRLTPHGPIYTEIASFPLAKRGVDDSK